MTKAANFLNKVKVEEKSLEKLAKSLKEAGDDRLVKELAKGDSLETNEAGLIALSMLLRDNGDDRLWKELNLDNMVKENAEIAATVEKISSEKIENSSRSVAGKFLASI